MCTQTVTCMKVCGPCEKSTGMGYSSTKIITYCMRVNSPKERSMVGASTISKAATCTRENGVKGSDGAMVHGHPKMDVCIVESGRTIHARARDISLTQQATLMMENGIKTCVTDMESCTAPLVSYTMVNGGKTCPMEEELQFIL